MADLVLGVDSSTQSSKVEIRDADTGAVVATARASHPATEPPVSEQDPASWWRALVDACGQIDPAVRAEVRAVSVAGQQHGLVLLDEAGSPLRPAKLWNDTTSAPQADALVEKLGAARWAESCGSRPVASFTVTKLAWIAAYEPHLLAQVARMLLPHDYLTWRLTGRFVTDRGDASGTGWFSPTTGDYQIDLITMAAGDVRPWRELLPDVLGPTDSAGPLRADAARELGLPAGVVVAPGTGDNMAAALGLGLGPGDVAMSLGTSGTVYAVSDRPAADATGAVAGFADATGRFLPLVCTLNATKVTDTVARWLGVDAAGLGALAQAAPDGPGPVLVPYFDGERTPNRPDATGVMSGLRPATSREQIARAAHDGVLCGLIDGLDALRAAGVDPSGTLHLIGGGARSAAYRQRTADLHGAPIVVPDTDETVATGAALQAAVVWSGAGFEDVAQRWRLGTGERIEPTANPEATADVRAAYQAEVARLG